MTFSAQQIGARSLGGKALCFVSPARYAGSSFTYAKRFATQTPSEVLDV